MKRWLLALILVLLFPNISYSRDEYSNINWETSFNIDHNINVKSINKLTKNQIRIVKSTFYTGRQLLQLIVNNDCEVGLNIRIVKDHQELNNKLYFPNENTYADDDKVIVGRYFSSTKTIYIVPVDNNKYYWKKNFTHELAHHYIETCGFDEHKLIKYIIGE